VILLFGWPVLVGIYFAIRIMMTLGNYTIKEEVVIDQD
jgi:hypothetical protein